MRPGASRLGRGSPLRSEFLPAGLSRLLLADQSRHLIKAIFGSCRQSTRIRARCRRRGAGAGSGVCETCLVVIVVPDQSRPAAGLPDRGASSWRRCAPCVRKQVGHQVRLGAIEVDVDRAESFCPTSTPRMHPGREAMRWETLDWHGPRRRQQGHGRTRHLRAVPGPGRCRDRHLVPPCPVRPSPQVVRGGRVDETQPGPDIQSSSCIPVSPIAASGIHSGRRAYARYFRTMS